jgi:hypothetical protein
MKKIYVTILGAIIAGQMSAQTLTKITHEPIIGDGSTSQGYDSTGVVPKNTGAGLIWDFSTLTSNTITGTSTFVDPTSVASATAYPGTTIAEDAGGGSYSFYKSTSTPTTQFEILGFYSPGLSMTYTNSAIASVWPVSMGYSVTDTYAGTVDVSGSAGPLSGTITTTGSGTGTLIAPGGATLTNVLQVKTANRLTLSIAGGLFTGTIVSTDYAYYQTTQKTPVLYVSYQRQTLSSFSGPTVTTSADISMNTQVITGINDHNFEASFQIFPNPAKEAINVKLSNAKNENSFIEIYNSVGMLIRKVELGNESTLTQLVNISDLNSGIYIVKTTLGTKQSSRKLIVE